jgi:hypothetical protein
MPTPPLYLVDDVSGCLDRIGLDDEIGSEDVPRRIGKNLGDK